jgi:hypothetical protein
VNFPVQLFDPSAQGFQLFFAGCRLRRQRGQPQQKKENPRQTFTFPWAATDATRRATSSGSPR